MNKFDTVRFTHQKRDFNKPADYLATIARKDQEVELNDQLTTVLRGLHSIPLTIFPTEDIETPKGAEL